MGLSHERDASRRVERCISPAREMNLSTVLASRLS
jgi:hypothetical protein